VRKLVAEINTLIQGGRLYQAYFIQHFKGNKPLSSLFSGNFISMWPTLLRVKHPYVECSV